MKLQHDTRLKPFGTKSFNLTDVQWYSYLHMHAAKDAGAPALCAAMPLLTTPQHTQA